MLLIRSHLARLLRHPSALRLVRPAYNAVATTSFSMCVMAFPGNVSEFKNEASFL